LEKYRKFIKPLSFIGIALVIFFLGYLFGHQNLVFEKNLRPKLFNKEVFKPRNVDFSIFWSAWNKVMDQYPGNPDQQEMIYGAISGMVDSIGDPYSSFMKPGDSKNFLEDLSGSIQGIGAELAVKDKKLTIVSPLASSPAEKAGLKPNDYIAKIDGVDTFEMPISDAISKIRGKAGTKVILSIIRDDWTQTKDFEITRAVVKIKSVEWKKLDDIAVIQISQFGEDTQDLLKEAATEIAKQNPKGVILDLRSNPGGYLESAVQVANVFIDKDKVVVKEKNKAGRIQEEKTTEDPILGQTKLVILVNGGSASASEIVAGALQDYKRAQLIGEKTFGKGSVQSLEELNDKSNLRLTIAKWLTPLDRAIDKIGIEPDIKVELTEDDFKNNRDPQLDKALELLK